MNQSNKLTPVLLLFTFVISAPWATAGHITQREKSQWYRNPGDNPKSKYTCTFYFRSSSVFRVGLFRFSESASTQNEAAALAVQSCNDFFLMKRDQCLGSAAYDSRISFSTKSHPRRLDYDPYEAKDSEPIQMGMRCFDRKSVFNAVKANGEEPLPYEDYLKLSEPYRNRAMLEAFLDIDPKNQYALSQAKLKALGYPVVPMKGRNKGKVWTPISHKGL